MVARRRFRKTAAKRKRPARRSKRMAKRSNRPSYSVVVRKTISFPFDTNAIGGGSNNYTAGTPLNGTYTTIGGYIDLNFNPAIAGTVAYFPWVYSFDISNVPDLINYCTLYDKYRIRKTTLKITPLASVSASDIGATGFGLGALSPMLHWVFDPDSVTMPVASEAGLRDLMGYTSYKMHRLTGKSSVRTQKPIATGIIEQTGGGQTIGTELKHSAWLDTADLKVVHFGVRGIFEGIPVTALAQQFIMRAEVTYTVEFAAPR